MIYTSLEHAIEYGKAHGASRVFEMRCPRCDRTVYAATDDERHEHVSWFEELKRNKHSRHVSCKRCGYGSLSSAEGGFHFRTHEIGQK